VTDSLKEKAILEYKRLKAKLGRQPSLREYESIISKRQIIKLFCGYSKLVEAAGDEASIPFHLKPNKMTRECALENWGKAVEKLKHQPTQAEWIYNKFKPSVPWYTEKFGGWTTDVPNAFLVYSQGKPQWNEIVKLMHSSKLTMPPLESGNLVVKNDYSQYIPPAVHDLAILAVKEGASLEFEKNVNLVFQLLGFKVQKLGQGTGRNNDGIAVDLENHFAVFLDAKARRDGYAVGTDDRAFIEYVRTHEGEIKRQGIAHLYFVVVSSRFKGNIARSADNLKKETGIKSLVLIPAALLLKLIAAKVRFPAEFSLEEFRGLLNKDGEIERRKVDRLMMKLENDTV